MSDSTTPDSPTPRDRQTGGNRTPVKNLRRTIAGLAVGGVAGLVILCIDVWTDGILSDDNLTLAKAFPGWFVALAAVAVLLKLVATTPDWSDTESTKLGAQIKLFADFVAISAASYAALAAVTFSTYPLMSKAMTSSDPVRFSTLVGAFITLLVLVAILLSRRKVPAS